MNEYECVINFSGTQTVYIKAESSESAQKLAAEMFDPFEAMDNCEVDYIDANTFHPWMRID